MNKILRGLYNLLLSIYDDVLVKKYKDQHFWILSAFLPTFIIARLLVRYDPHIFLQAHGQHVHHFTYGFLLLAIAGYLGIVRKNKAPIWLAIMFGIGLALAVDETGMWLHLTNYYYNDVSENALVISSVFLINVVYFRELWIRLLRDLTRFIKEL